MSGSGTVEVDRAGRGVRRFPGPLVALIVLLGLLAVGAIQGGWAMVADPQTPLGMSTEFLEGTPISDYLLAGWFLLGIAAASLITVAGLLLPWRWGWARGIERVVGYRWPWVGAVSTGAVLLVFEILELFMVPFHPVMHPLLIAASVALVLLPFAPSVRKRLRVNGGA